MKFKEGTHEIKKEFSVGVERGEIPIICRGLVRLLKVWVPIFFDYITYILEFCLRSISFLQKLVGANCHILKKWGCHDTHGTHVNEDPDLCPNVG